MEKAFIFPGQASQFVGMGKDLFDEFSLAREYFDQANDIMGLDLKKICFEGPEEEIKQTYITQPAIFVHSVIVSKLLQDRGLEPDSVAGHSLGEYSALVSAGAIEFDAALRLVKKRGELMYKAGIEKPGTMAAIIGMEPEQVEELCELAADAGIVQPANFNSPGQIAVSGDVKAVLRIIDLAREKGAKKAVQLVVSGAFHSPLMEEARHGLQDALEQTKIKDARVPLYSNVAARAVQDQATIREQLYKQLTHPVRWQESMQNMIKDGYNQFYEVGPGKVLKGLLKRIDRSTRCVEIGTVEDLNSLEI